ncbi:hypothetical protein PFISCL1PPCAC_19465, partial [Pristionchus fissidentatus]
KKLIPFYRKLICHHFSYDPMIQISLIHHSISSILSILINIIIIRLSMRSSNDKLCIKGEFKWIFLSTSITNVLYSILHLLFIPVEIRNTSDPCFYLYLSMSPLSLIERSPEVLSPLFQFLYSRQTMANVISISVIPLHRVAIVCYNQKKRNRLFLKLAYSVNVIPLLLRAPSYFLPRTTIYDLPAMMNQSINESLIEFVGLEASNRICYFSHNWREIGDIVQTLTDFSIIIASYLITIICIIKLVVYLAHKWKERSNSKGNLERQKAIIFTVVVQAILPLITYTPYLIFIFSLIIHGAESRDHSESSIWYDHDYQLLILSWSPFINGVSTVLLLKPYRRGLFGMFPCFEIVPPSNRTRAEENLRAVSYSLNTPSGSNATVYRTYEIAAIDEDRSAFNSESG